MTERSTVNSSTILGANYEVITLTSNNYNPTIDEQVVITATVKDVYGDPITGKSLQLYLNGTSMGSEYISITNNQGLATWTVTLEDIGLNSFSVTNANVIINVKDKWNVLLNDGTYYISVKGDTVQFSINSSISTSFPTTFTAFSGGAKVPAEYRPSYSVVVPCKSNYPFYVAIRPDGTVERKTNASSSQSGGVYCFAEWTI